MMFNPDQTRIFGLECGVDFPRALVDGIMARIQGQPPEALGRVTVFVNSARMRRRLVALFAERGAMILPRLRLVTDLSDTIYLHDIPKAVPNLRRKLQLSVLIQGLIDADPSLAPRAALADLTESLGALLSEMQVEGVTPAQIMDLDISDFAAHWERTRRFLGIVAPFFCDPNQPDPNGRQRLIAERITAQWADAPTDQPIIVAGSTGSRGTTALFMRAVARLPQGAVVLPGLDRHMPRAVWDRLDQALTSEDHPQFRFRKLALALDLHPADIPLWHDTPPPDRARNRVVSLALRPAPVTDQWIREGQTFSDLPGAMAGVCLLEAESPKQEALSIAVILRDAIERGERAALITPDRNLSRQVAAALQRWGIVPDDSAGVPLNQTPTGRFLRHIARMRCVRMTSDQLLVLLKHPLASSAMDRGQHLLLARELELHLRRYGPAFPDGAALVAWAGRQKIDGALGWATALAGFIDQVGQSTGRMPLANHVDDLVKLAERLARGPEPEGSGALWAGAVGREVGDFISGLRGEADHGGNLTASEFRDLFDHLLSAAQARAMNGVHPLVSIWGTIEARVQGAELVILGGLNDGVWPALPPPDPWLNRKMRAQAGLLLPERRIGLSAHDFQQAIAAPKVVLTRALRNAEAETVPSRWINRLTNLLSGLPHAGGPEALARMRAAGKAWLALSAGMDRPVPNPPEYLLPAPRPAPTPPLSARPSKLPVTKIETLIRDPFAVYAERILKLGELRPLRQMPDARDRGTALHRIMERFVRETPLDESVEQARVRILAISHQVLAEDVPWPATRMLWAARIAAATDRILAISGGVPIVLEEGGTLTLQDPPFVLYGKPDRIDLLPDGTLLVVDYKSGPVPSAEQIRTYAKQLHLIALIAEEGGFAKLGPMSVSALSYVGLAPNGKETRLGHGAEDLAGTRDGLLRLLRAYRQKGQGYASRRAVMSEQQRGTFDHLARFGEWEMTDSSVQVRVGDEDG